MDQERFKGAIRSIYVAVTELEAAFPERRFTPDGHMVGSIGEAIAHHYYGVKLYPPGVARVDGEWQKRPIQIKATQGRDTYLKEPKEGDLLLVLHLMKSGEHKVVYFNDAMRVWKSREGVKVTKAGEKFVSFRQLNALGLPEVQE